MGAERLGMARGKDGMERLRTRITRIDTGTKSDRQKVSRVGVDE